MLQTPCVAGGEHEYAEDDVLWKSKCQVGRIASDHMFGTQFGKNEPTARRE